MAAPKRKPFQIHKDRVEIATLYLQGKLQFEIAQILSTDQARGYTLTQQTISRDLKMIQRDWQRSTIVKFDEARAQELAKIDNLEREYWRAWERSKTEKKHSEKEKTEGVQLKEVTRVEKWELIGDHRFLEGIQWCINRRCELLGLDAPKRMHIFEEDLLSKINWDSLTKEQMQRIVNGEEPTKVIPGFKFN
jgi:hypothetical protein